MTQHPGFEKAIDENPLEATTHLAYADWHDENGNPEEAAFRRSMGEWVRSKGLKGNYTSHQRFPFAAWGHSLPDGVSGNLLPLWDRRLDVDGSKTIRTPRGHYAPKDPTHAWQTINGSYGSGQPGLLRWQTYRNMEEAFRRAFMANRKQNLSRTASAVARVIRGGN